MAFLKSSELKPRASRFCGTPQSTPPLPFHSCTSEWIILKIISNLLSLGLEFVLWDVVFVSNYSVLALTVSLIEGHNLSTSHSASTAIFKEIAMTFDSLLE